MQAYPRHAIGKPIHPNVGIAASYQRQLQLLLNDMQASILYWLAARWRDPRARAAMAMDESWINSLKRTLRELANRWQKQFDEAAPKLASHFAKSIEERTTSNLQRILDEGGFTVNFKMTPNTRTIMQASIAENVGLIKSIAAEHLTDIEGIVLRSVTTGRDLKQLSDDLQERYGVVKDRAALIAHDQNNKATAVITRARQAEADITHAVWVHSSAGKHPRPEHVAFSKGTHYTGGPTYVVAKGAYLEGVWTWPGHEINCRCFSRPVLPGFS